MTAVLAPLVAPGPAGPADPPLLWAVLGWVRRQFTEDAANGTSVPKPLQTAEIEPLQTAEIEPLQTAEIEPLAAAQAEAVDTFAAADAAAVQALLPADFERTVVVAGLNGPVAFRFLPNGEILFAEKNGAIKVFDVITCTRLSRSPSAPTPNAVSAASRWIRTSARQWRAPAMSMWGTPRPRTGTGCRASR